MNIEFRFNETTEALMGAERASFLEAIIVDVIRSRSIMASALNTNNSNDFIAGLSGLAGIDMGNIMESARQGFSVALNMRLRSGIADYDRELLNAADALIDGLRYIYEREFRPALSAGKSGHV